jgi:hydroxymethylpyrimidine/phosphomethylpyrimidine kinase
VSGVLRALTIGGSDPSGGAGIQQDLITFSAAGVHGLSAITSVTVQDTSGVGARNDVAGHVVAAQVEAVLGDIGADVVKTGMLPAAETVAAVVAAITWPIVLVIDPVFAATSGHRLVDADGIDAVRRELIPRASVVTPNAAEAAALTGIRVVDESSQHNAAEAIVAMGARACVVTGGHLAGPDSVDVLVTEHGSVAARVARADLPPVRGTGCRYAATIAVHLARGIRIEQAVVLAQAATADAMRRSRALGRGARILGAP